MAEIPFFSQGAISSGEQKNHNPIPSPSGSSPDQSLPQSPHLEEILSSEFLELQRQAPLSTTGTSAIRTMKSDIERLFKTTPLSVAQMIGKSGSTNPRIKKNARIASLYLVLGVMVVILLIIASGAYYFWNSIFPPPSATEIKKATPPAPFFATENSRTIEVGQRDHQQFIKLINDSMQEFERDGTTKRILIKFSDTVDQRFADIADFFDVYHIIPPQGFLKRLSSGLMMFVYTSSGTRLGLAVRTTDPTRTMRDMLDWEPNMLVDLKPLFFGQQLAPVTATFEDRSYHNIDWRYFKLSSNTDTGIGYTIFPAGNILVITTSRVLMETVINRLFDVR